MIAIALALLGAGAALAALSLLSASQGRRLAQAVLTSVALAAIAEGALMMYLFAA